MQTVLTATPETLLRNDVLGSDGELRSRIKHAIERSWYREVRRLAFAVEDGVVTVRGRFPSFYLCQVAIESVKRVPGVVQVLNQIEVVYEPMPQRTHVESDVEPKPRLKPISLRPRISHPPVTSFPARQST